MSKMVYEWRRGLETTRVPAQVAGERFESLRVKNNGQLTPRAVVQDARPAGSVLHPLFEWDDAVAAEKHREQQARTLIGAVVVKLPQQRAEASPVRAFVNVRTEDEGQRYTSTVQALSDDGLRRQVLERAWRELQTWQARYRELSELSDLFATIDQIGRDKGLDAA